MASFFLTLSLTPAYYCRRHFNALSDVTRAQRRIRMDVVERWKGYAASILTGPFKVRRTASCQQAPIFILLAYTMLILNCIAVLNA